MPRWAAAPKAAYACASLTHFEALASSIELQVQRLLEEHNYNTLGNFLDLYRGWRRDGEDFQDFFRKYNPPITDEHHTCVGLALELWNRLHQLDWSFPDLSKHLFIVSCEEEVEALGEYTALCERLDTAAYDLEKEHVLLCLKVQINERHGLILLDPGYHVGRVVTVMQDKAYPHTGWFVQSEENGNRKEYSYQFSPLSDKFVEWQEKNVKNGIQTDYTGLIYIARPYLTSVDVTERRNLVYNFRSLLSRDAKGHLIAGLYFKVRENTDDFTIFYQDMGQQRIKMKFSSFLEPDQVKGKTLNIITICNEQLNLAEGSLLEILRETAELMMDKIYLRQLLEVDASINIMSGSN